MESENRSQGPFRERFKNQDSLSLRGAGGNEAIPGCGQRLLRYARNDFCLRLSKQFLRKPAKFFLLVLFLFSGLRLSPALAHSPLTPSTQHSTPLVEGVDAVGMTVSNMDQSIEFYTKVLSFEKISDTEVWGAEYERLQGVFGLRMRVVRLRIGSETLELTEYLTPKGRPFPPDSRGNDRWFQHVAIIVSDMEKAYTWLRQHKVQHASTGPQRLPDWNPNAGGVKAFYFRDPDGHFLEILWFPPGKGDPKWHQTTDKLFLGIDHTALVVGNTEASLQFYRDTLGMRIIGESENYGEEQEHLNNVFGARLRITSMRAASGPGIEFLEYLTPRDGRLYPGDAHANDLLHWQTQLTSTNVEEKLARLRPAMPQLISPGVVMLSSDSLGFRKALTVRDPDGHALRIIEQGTAETK